MRKIDTSDPSKLSDADRRYLQDRGQHIALGLDPLPVTAPQDGWANTTPTGDVDASPPDGGSVPNGGKAVPLSNRSGAATPETTTSYDDQTVAQLKAEIDSRNDGREGDAVISKSGSKQDLIDRLVADDSSSDDIEED